MEFAAVLDLTVHVDRPVVQHFDGDLRVLDVAIAQAAREAFAELVQRQAFGLHLADERQGDLAERIDFEGAGEVVLAIDRDFQLVADAQAIDALHGRLAFARCELRAADDGGPAHALASSPAVAAAAKRCRLGSEPFTQDTESPSRTIR